MRGVRHLECPLIGKNTVYAEATIKRTLFHKITASLILTIRNVILSEWNPVSHPLLFYHLSRQ